MFAGYFSARLYKTLNGQKWKRAALVTGTLYPGVVASLAFILNFFIWGKHSSGAVGYQLLVSFSCNGRVRLRWRSRQSKPLSPLSSILATDSCEMSQSTSAESPGFSPGAPVSSHSES